MNKWKKWRRIWERAGREAETRERPGRGRIFQTFPKWDPGSFQEEATAVVTGKILNVLIVR